MRQEPRVDLGHPAEQPLLVGGQGVPRPHREAPDSLAMPDGPAGGGQVSEELADLNRAIDLDPDGPGPSPPAARSISRWNVTTRRWPTSTAPSNSTPAPSPPET